MISVINVSSIKCTVDGTKYISLSLSIFLEVYIYIYNSLINNLSYSTIVLYSRDHKGVGVAHKKSPKIPASIYPDGDGAVLGR